MLWTVEGVQKGMARVQQERGESSPRDRHLRRGNTEGHGWRRLYHMAQSLSVGARMSCRPAVRVHVLHLYQRGFTAVKRAVLYFYYASVLPACWLMENAAHAHCLYV